MLTRGWGVSVNPIVEFSCVADVVRGFSGGGGLNGETGRGVLGGEAGRLGGAEGTIGAKASGAGFTAGIAG